MAIRAPFRLLLASLIGISTPIAIWPACAESQSPSSDFFEVSAPSPPSGDPVRPTQAVDTNKEEPSLRDDSSVWIPDDFDAWAYAFAESSRLQSPRLRLVRVPAYSVAMNSHVKFFVDRFTTTHREVVGLWVRRSGQYLGMIFGVFKAKGIPEDLAFTAMIESGFNPVAVSRVGAKGLWQFMAPTARLYGLRVDRWVDERLDPEKATVAAAGYLNDLYVRYGSWELAQAAYNAGEVKIDKAIRATGSADFWNLRQSKYLRRETKDFVPAIQAAMVIGRDPGQYGFEPSLAAMPDVDRVTVPASTDLRKLASSSGTRFGRALGSASRLSARPPSSTARAGSGEGRSPTLRYPRRISPIRRSRRHGRARDPRRQHGYRCHPPSRNPARSRPSRPRQRSRHWFGGTLD